AASVKEICYFTGVTAAVVTNLERKGIVEFFDEEVYRTFLDTDRPEDKREILLTDEQKSAYDRLINIYNSGKGGAALLYGVTGSGKTQVFLRLVDQVTASGKQAIVMVPEISLTPQTLSLFHNRYGGKIAVFHSAMSMGQRMDEWKRVKRGEAIVAIGTRSAIFAPFNNLGLVIIDEEQEHTYKSESSPRYHARDAARFRCAENKALLLLASATPSIETFTAAVNGRYELCKLTKRYGNAKLPTVETVDMNAEIQSGNKSMLSRTLVERLKENIENGKQSIILLNRRGHNTFVSCGGCGEVASCPNCSISLTYHSANNRLMCHYCGYSMPFTEKCANCGNEHIRYSGAGTQRVEQELQLYLPEARILRVDADSTMARSSFEKMLGDFGKKKYDIMLGTQMVAKGLDFSNVTLVGVLGADGLLYSDDYRCFERAFSLLTQVVGRSGRGENKGTALIQTVTPDNTVIGFAAEQDYDKFYEQEILTRKIMIYPPYCELCLVGFVGENKEEVRASATAFFDRIRSLNERTYTSVKMIILGPSQASIPRVGGKYRYRIIIKTKNTSDFRKIISTALKDFGRDRRNKNVT
ncbi:MAG: primosomal protein N', partial [Clostridia bacterium]|nr:primosomal protein N' [Clostridia bacterium]